MAVAAKPGTKQLKAQQRAKEREESAGRAANEIAQALVEYQGDTDSEEKLKHGKFSFRPKPPKEGYRDNSRSSRDE